jgi:YD repeat-containing protein
MQYDAAGRISRIDNLSSGAWKYWAYPDRQDAVQTLTTINSTATPYYQITVVDGAGRLRAQGGDLPNVTGQYWGQFTFYDVMGRATQTSNPAEINSIWTPVGEDAAGWVWTQQAYDWKGRPTLTTLPSTDGGQTSPTKLITYGGCGCAGGEVVTLRDEVGRQQRMTADVLGRAWKSEVLNWDGTTVYSTTTNSYNARDQITSAIEQVGTSGTSQTTTLTYDGYGRLKTQQSPAQTASTQYSYNPDDTTNTVTDGRAIVTTFGYNNRQQVSAISYNHQTGIAQTPSITFGYDAAGNRTSMADGSGSVSYQYDQLSRLTSESRQFTGLSGTYTLSYGYNLSGELTSVTDPDGKVVNYGYDNTGKMTNITGTSFAGVTSYVSNLKYRAWGAVKEASYGDSTVLSANYNSRLQPTDFSVSNTLTKHYEYNADGRLRYSKNNSGDRFDRSYTYDHVGRVIAAFSGPEARGQADTDVRPYRLIYQYDAMNHLTSLDGRWWSGQAPSQGGSYSNDKNVSWFYDADGRLTSSGETQYSYDAAGRATSITGEEGDLQQTQVFDGTGTRTMLDSQQVTHNENGTTTTESKTQYFITSSVLGGVVTELDQNGNKERTFVYQGGEILAWQQKSGSTETMTWEHRDASNASVKAGVAAELDPLGMNAGVINPFPSHSTRPPLQEARTYPGFADMMSGSQCRVDGIDTPCSLVSGENSIQCPDNDCGPRMTTVYITYKSGRKETYSGMTGPFTRNAHFTGTAAAAAGELFHIGMNNNESFGSALLGALVAGDWLSRKGGMMDSANHFAQQKTVIGFDTLWEDLADIIKDGTCRSFIADLVGTLQEQTGKQAHAFSVEGMLAELAKNPKNGTNGIGLYDINQGGKKVLIGEGGWDDNGKGYANISEIISTGGDTPSAHRDLARMLLHEIIHTATKFKSGFSRDGGYTDVEVARAIFEITGDWHDDPRDPRNNPPDSHPTSVGGVIFNRVLQKYCK